MARKSTLYGEHHFADAVTFADVALPSSTVTNANIVAGAGIDASKVNHQYTVDAEIFAPTTTITAVDKLLKIVRGATGTVVEFEAAIVTNPTGADRTVSVDLHKSTGAGAFATILSAPIAFNDSSVDRTATSATISSGSLVAGDILKVVVTVAGAAGAQAAGLVVSLTQIETPA